MSREEFLSEGAALFGPDRMQWKFICPVCGNVACGNDYIKAGATQGAVGFSCIGRWTGGRDAFGSEGPGPCNYAGGGLFGLNPLRVQMPEGDHFDFFEFARPAGHDPGAMGRNRNA